jgi:hypothetical protein
MIKLLDLSTRYPSPNWAHTHFTSIKGVAFGEYALIPLEYKGSSAYCSLNQAIAKIEEQVHSPQNEYTNAYTRGHYGEEKHRWYVVAYEAYMRADGKKGLLHLEFAPVYPDMFPRETKLTEVNMYDSYTPEIEQRILDDCGSLSQD